MPRQVTVRALTAVLGASPLALPAGPTDPRVDLTAATLGLTWAGGRMELAATALTAVGHAPGAGCGPGKGTVVNTVIKDGEHDELLLGRLQAEGP